MITTPFRLACAVAIALTVSVTAQETAPIRLGTLAPANSPWTSALRSMGSAWDKTTGRRVRLVVHAGTFPSESSVISRMAVNGLEAATLTAGGLSELDEAFNVFGVPFFFASDAELVHVQLQLTPLIRERLRARRYHFLNWGNAGWVRIFSKKPIRTLDDLRQAKLYTTEGHPTMVQWYTANGFHAVPLAAGEIPKQLMLPTGTITAAPLPPVYAVALQIHKDAPYMLDLPLAPLVSATVMSDAAWNRIAPPDRAKMLVAAAAMEKEIATQAPGLDARSIAAMKTVGLRIVELDDRAVAAFRGATEKLGATQRGAMIPSDVYDRAVSAREAFRKAKPAR
jgi:TRAP-type C4-dicarboxylate transport system substrate-binding protein